ncbi:MAG: hypothetical protein MJY68_07380 [Bacteroidaceae bacterium]|nr:hypothetical protein [Bacteroidaceae bacterium]
MPIPPFTVTCIGSEYIFLGALLLITLYSFFQIIGHNIRPKVGEKPIGMNIIIQIVMITAAALVFFAVSVLVNSQGAVVVSTIVATLITKLVY